jgi:hypothetical protein
MVALSPTFEAKQFEVQYLGKLVVRMYVFKVSRPSLEGGGHRLDRMHSSDFA